MNWSSHKTRVRRFLRDPDSRIWADAFLLRLFNDEQNDLQNEIGQVEDVRVVMIPSRMQSCYLYNWEWPHNDNANGETFQPGYYNDTNTYVCTNIWEHEHLDDLTPTTSSYGEFYTQPWEVWEISTPCEPPPVPFPNGFYRAKFVAWDRKPIEPTTRKELQDRDRTWKTRQGDPMFYYRDEELSNKHFLYPLPSSVTWSDYRLWTDLVVNGGFDDSGTWSLGTGWSISSGVASSDGSQSANSNLTQSAILTDAVLYWTRYTVSGRTAGTITISVGSAGAGTARSADGTYTEYIKCSGSTDLLLTANKDFVGNVDNVEVRAVTLGVTSIDTDPDEAAYSTTALDVDDNLIVIFDKNTTDLSADTDSSAFATFLHKYIEKGVIARAYGGNTDGRIPSLSEYWQMRKEVGVRAIKRYLAKRMSDRDYRLQPRNPMVSRSRRHPRLPSTYPSTYP